MNSLQRYLNTYRNFSLAIWLNILAIFLITFGFMMSSFFTLFLNQKNIPIREIALILGVGGVGTMIGSYLSGITCHYLNPNRVAQFSLIGFAIIMASFPLFNSILIFFILNFLANFFFGFFRPANNIVLFAHAEPSERTRVMALYRVAFNLGLAFATSIGGFLAAINFNLFFLFSASMGSIGAIILLIFNTQLSAKVLSSKSAITPRIHKFKDVLLNHPYLLLCVLFLFYNLLFLQMRSTFGLYLEDAYHLSLRQIGLLFMINFLMIVFLEVPIMTRCKNMNQITLVLWGTLFVGAGLSILPLGHSASFAAISVILWSTGEILATSPFFVLALEFAHPQAPSFYIGFFQTVMSLGIILAPIIGGFLYPFHHGYFLWSSCGIISIIMIYGFLHLKKMENIFK